MNKVKRLVFDIETSPIIASVWGLRDVTIGPEQIIESSSVLSFAAKMVGAKGTLFFSTQGQENLRNDKKILILLGELINNADEIITQNGKAFDLPIVLGRMAVHGIRPPAIGKHHDTCLMARRMGYATSKLAYLTKLLCPELEKGDHAKFPGQKLWTECLKGNKAAWKEMEAYNKLDVLGTEAVFKRLAPYSNIPRLDVYSDTADWVCGACGGTEWYSNGHAYGKAGKFKRYRCKGCGAPAQESGAKNNLLSKEKKQAMKGRA
jgi:RNase_H superfamily